MLVGKRCLRHYFRIPNKCLIGCIFMLIKQFSDHSRPVDGLIVLLWGIGMVAKIMPKIMACPAFLNLTLSMMGW